MIDEFITLDPDDFEHPDLVVSAVEALNRLIVAFVNLLTFSEVAKILRATADVLDQQTARNERGRSN